MNLRLFPAAALVLLPVIFAAPAHAVLPAGNVVQNGDAEAGPGATNETDAPAVPGWDVIPSFTAVVYGTGRFPDRAISQSIGGGNNFFAGGPDSGFGDGTAAVQEIDLSGAAPEIQAGNVKALLSADLGGFGSEDDSASVIALFTDENGNGTTAFPSVQGPTASERNNQTGFARRVSCVPLPTNSRRAIVELFARRTVPSYNDAYIDNVSVTLSTADCPPPPLQPSTEPQPGVTGNAAVVSGKVKVKVPGSDEFQELDEESSIPIGSEVDATKGAVKIETAANTSGATQSGTFSLGSFQLLQNATGRLQTDLALAGRSLDKCPKAGGKVQASARRSRRLFGNARGRFRTRGRYASATVRGTKWSVTDTCTTTEVRVTQGTVTVRDLVKRKNITLKKGKRYVARARRR